MPTATTDAPRTSTAPAADAGGRRPFVWVVWVALLVVVAVGVVALGALPYRAWVAQREQLQQTEARLRAIQDQNASLEQRIAALQTPAEVERLARERYGLARPGEQSFVILPQAADPLPGGWPYSVVGEILAARTAAAASPATAPTADTTVASVETSVAATPDTTAAAETAAVEATAPASTATP
jgi:cell division protein FtsB